jgi:hypothetical protein
MKKSIKKLISIFFVSILFFSCSDRELTKSEIIGNYGAKGDWYFEFNSSLDLRSYLKDTAKAPSWLLELEAEKSKYDGIVYMEKSTGEAGLGLWKHKGIADWGGTKVFIKWQKYGFMDLSLYRDGSWYFKKSGGTIYFTASDLDFSSKIATWPRK